MAYLTKNLDKIILYSSLLGVGVLRISVAVGNIFFAISLLCFIYWCYTEKINPWQQLKERVGIKLLTAYGVFLVCFLPSVLFSDVILESFKQLLEMFVFRVMPFVIVVVTANGKESLEKLLIGLMVIEIADCATALYQTFALNIYNAYGFGFHYLNLAGLLACVVPVVAVITLDRSFPQKVRKVATLACIVTLACAFVGSKSRALWLIMFIVMPLIALNYRKVIFEHKGFLAGLLVSVLVAGGFFLSSERNIERLSSVTNTTSNASNVARIYMWKSCLKMMEDYPVGGVGLGNYKRYYDDYYEMAAVPTKGYAHPHNSYLHLGAQAGVPGLAAIIIATLAIFYTSFRKWFQEGCVYYYMLAVCWLGFALFGIVEPIIDSTVHAKLISLLGGIFCAGVYWDGKEKGQADE